MTSVRLLKDRLLEDEGTSQDTTLSINLQRQTDVAHNGGKYKLNNNQTKGRGRHRGRGRGQTMKQHLKKELYGIMQMESQDGFN